MSQKGFSLVELLIVVTLVGIISGIAVVNFGKYQRSGKTVEAKVLLSNIYGNEKIFFIENDNYHPDLEVIGLELTGKYIYNAGFSSPAGGTCNTAFGSGSDLATTCAGQQIRISRICGFQFAATQSYHQDDCMWDHNNTPSNHQKIKQISSSNCEVGGSLNPTVIIPSGESRFTQFTALACGSLGTNVIDVWSIDHRKDLKHRKDGT